MVTYYFPCPEMEISDPSARIGPQSRSAHSSPHLASVIEEPLNELHGSQEARSLALSQHQKALRTDLLSHAASLPPSLGNI